MTHHPKPSATAPSASKAAPAAGRSNLSAKAAAQRKHSVPASDVDDIQTNTKQHGTTGLKSSGAAAQQRADEHDTSEAAAGAVNVSQQGSIHTLPQGQSSGKGPAGGQGTSKGFAQGPGKRKGAAKGQRPSTAPASPAGASSKILKPSRCQKCHTCRHKQLKKQCLRNKASSLSGFCIAAT